MSEFELQSDLYQRIKERLPEGYQVEGEYHLGDRRRIDLCILDEVYVPFLGIEVKLRSSADIAEQMLIYNQAAPRLRLCVVIGRDGMEEFLAHLLTPAGIRKVGYLASYGSKVRGYSRTKATEAGRVGRKVITSRERGHGGLYAMTGCGEYVDLVAPTPNPEPPTPPRAA